MARVRDILLAPFRAIGGIVIALVFSFWKDDDDEDADAKQ